MRKIKLLLGLFIISASISGQTRNFGENIEEGSIIEKSKIQNLFLAKEKFNVKINIIVIELRRLSLCPPPLLSD